LVVSCSWLKYITCYRICNKKSPLFMEGIID